MGAGCMEMRSSLAMGQDWDFRVVVPSCVLFHLTDNLIDDFRLYCITFLLVHTWLPISTQVKPLVGWGAKTIRLTYYKYDKWTPGLSHLLGLDAPEPTCPGEFILLGPVMAADFSDGPRPQEGGLWVCSDHQCPCGEGKMTPSKKGRDRLCLTNYLVISPRELGS